MRDKVRFGSREWSSAQYEVWLEQTLPLQVSARKLKIQQIEAGLRDSETLPLRISGPAVLRQGLKKIVYHGYRGFFEYPMEKPAVLGCGVLLLFPEYARFRAGEDFFTWRKEAFSCVTTNGRYFEFKIRRSPFFQILFSTESPLKYELIFRKWLAEPPSPWQNRAILEFQPRIEAEEPRPPRRFWNIPAQAAAPQETTPEKIGMEAVRLLTRLFLYIFLRVKIRQKENWRRVNHGWVICNHQSALDPFILAAYFDRQVAYLTKSTSFLSFVGGRFLRWAKSLPVRRYQTDPQIVRIVRRFAGKGYRVGIFPEGERSWGGELRHFKLGTVKMLMASRLPVTPVVLKHTFRFWPRWSNRPRPARVEILVLAPFCLIPHLYSVTDQRNFLENYYQRNLVGN